MQVQILSSAHLFPLVKRKHNAHKGDFGQVLVVGGDLGMGGAAIVAGLFSARVGAGKVCIATHKKHIAAALALEPCLMPKEVQRKHDLNPLLQRANAVVLGPGLGQSSWSKMLFTEVMKAMHPKIIDADALHLLKHTVVKYTHHNILTPHPGEAAALLDLTVCEIQEDRIAAIQALQSRFGGIIILKGAGTLIYDGITLFRCDQGNPGMASGGMGDALSGILGGLLAQGIAPMQAAQIGVLTHALAADQVAKEYGEYGILARDLIMPMRKIINGVTRF